MAGRGSVGAAGAGIPSLQEAARRAAASCCVEPAAVRTPPDAHRRGAPHHHRDLSQPLTGNLVACRPLPRPSVTGGGAAAAAPATLPQLAVLTALLDQAAPRSEAPPSPLRRLTILLDVTFARLSNLLPTIAPGPLAPGATEPPLQPMPPTLTFDPELGTIDLRSLDGPASLDPNPDTAGGDDAAALPSSWVAIAGYFSRSELSARVGSVADRISALLDEVGLTRMQLLLLTVLTPIALAFLIDVVARILG